jgi:hypothetical protein
MLLGGTLTWAFPLRYHYATSRLAGLSAISCRSVQSGAESNLGKSGCELLGVVTIAVHAVAGVVSSCCSGVEALKGHWSERYDMQVD